MRKTSALFAVALAALSVYGAGASAAEPKAAPAKAVAPAKDWTGVWTRLGTFSYDPTIKPEQREYPPYRPDWQAKYEAVLAAKARGEPIADPTSACVPGGMPRIMNMVYPMEIIQKPLQMTIIAEWDSQVRRIYLDGRPHPEDPDPNFNGHSIGHWEGDTLVVDTVGLRDDTVFDQTGIRHSGSLRLTERIRLLENGNLQDEITADDPIAFIKPWVVTKTYKRAPASMEIFEYVCQENNREIVRK